MGSEAKQLTAGQVRALAHLATCDYAPPAELGYAVEDKAKRIKSRPMKPQGAGRLGGSVGTNLVDQGLARREHTQFRGHRFWPLGYAITKAGRLALAQAQRAAQDGGGDRG